MKRLLRIILLSIFGIVVLIPSQTAFAFDQISNVRDAVEDIIAVYGDRYANGPEYLVMLDEFEKKFNQSDKSDQSLFAQFNEFKHKVLLENRNILAV